MREVRYREGWLTRPDRSPDRAWSIDGVGVEFKLPTSNAEVQRAIGQMDQYRERYADQLIIVLVPDFLEKAQTQMFTDQARAKSIAVVIK